MPAKLHDINSKTAHSFNPPEGLDLKKISEKNNIKIAQLVRLALIEYLERHRLIA